MLVDRVDICTVKSKKKISFVVSVANEKVPVSLFNRVLLNLINVPLFHGFVDTPYPVAYECENRLYFFLRGQVLDMQREVSLTSQTDFSSLELESSSR